MKKIALLWVFCMLVHLKTSAYESFKIYDNYVQMYVYGPSEVTQGEEFNITVVFRQTDTTFPFNRNGDMSKAPIFPIIDGLERMGPPMVTNNVEEGKKEGKVVSKTYATDFTYKMNAKEAGTYTLSGISIIFRGHLVKAQPEEFLVTPKSTDGDLIVVNEEGEMTEEVSVYESPFVAEQTEKDAKILEIRTYADRTEVDLSYISKGSNIWVSGDSYLQDTETREYVKLKTIQGDVGFDKKAFKRGAVVYYTLVFPAIDKSWCNVNILEDASGGFSFKGVGLASKVGKDGVAKQSRGQIEHVNWDNMRKIELNNYSSDFKFTDGLVPIYNKDVFKWGFFDEKGNQVIPFVWDYDDFKYPHFGGGYCIVSKKRKVNGFYYTDYYSLNRTGQPVKLNDVVKATPFCDGFAAVVKKGGKYTYIKGNGSEAFPARNQSIGSNYPMPVRPFNDGLSAYYDYSKRKYGFINKQGAWVVAPQYDMVHDFSEGLAAVMVSASNSAPDRWGFIDVKGAMVIPAQYTIEPSSFSKGCAVVQKRSGEKVMIDKKGVVVSPEFIWIFPFFSTGYTLANISNVHDFYIVDEEFRSVAGPIYGVDRKHKKYEDINGAFQLPVFGPGYSDSYTFLTTGGLLFKDSSWKKMGVMSENLIHFEGQDGHGFVDYEGNVIFQFVQSEF